MRKFILSFAILLSLAAPASAGPDAERHISVIVDQLGDVEEGREVDFVLDQVDMQRLSKFVLGKYGREAKPEEIDIFQSRLDQFLHDFLANRSGELSNATVKVLSSVDRNETDSIVTTRVSSPSRSPTLMRWRVLFRNGEWRVVDVEVHGLWLAIEQRAQIASLMDRGNVDILDLYPTENRKASAE